MAYEKMPIPATPGSGENPNAGNDHGQKPPTDENAVRQRKNLGTPPGDGHGKPIPKAP